MVLFTFAPSDIKHLFPIFTDYSSQMRDILREIGSDSEYLISTRIDSDDAFHENSINIIQKQFKRQKFGFINLLKGYILDINNNELYLSKEYKNPFISLIEENISGRSFKTILSIKHKAAGSIIKQVKRGVFWLRVIHDGNLLNEVRGKRIRKVAALNKFNLE